MEKKEYFIVDADDNIIMYFEVTDGVLKVIENIIENTLDNYE